MSSTPPPLPSDPSPGGARRGEILASNVDTNPEISAPGRPARRAGPLLAVLLVGLVGLVVGAAGVLFFSGGNGQNQPRPTSAAPTVASRLAPTLVPTVSASRRGSAAAVAGQPDVNGISCDTLESTLFHIHVHLAIFLDGREQLVPFGIGIGQPWQVSDSSEGPFVDDGSCFYWIHTHTQDGVLHIESPVRRRFTLGDFFAVWQVPLSATQVGPAQGAVIAYVNGQRDDTDPAAIALLPHARIQLNVGQDVPPYLFDFPPGD